MAPKGRRKYEPDRRKVIEVLSGDQYEFLKKMISRPEIATDLSTAWLHVQQKRLELAKDHLDVAEALNEKGVPGAIRPDKRSVISRAYYAMFCAARAAVSYHLNGDNDGHTELPKRLGKVPLGPQADRDRVVAALTKFRAARNEADYSPFYPTPLGRDSGAAIAEARAVLRICTRWINETARERKTSAKKSALSGGTP